MILLYYSFNNSLETPIFSPPFGGVGLLFFLVDLLLFLVATLALVRLLRSTTKEHILSLLPKRNAFSVKRFAAFSTLEHDRISSATCLFDITSHRPSDASTRKASFSVRSYRSTSGLAITYSLNALSPMARDTARTPSTRHTPTCTTIPPAFS